MKMKHLYSILFLLFLGVSLQGQDRTVLEEGAVSFLSSRNVYVKFASTKNIEIGDTLFIKPNEALIPAIVVTNKSSTSAVCSPIIEETIAVGTPIFAKTVAEEEQEEKQEAPSPPAVEEEAVQDAVTPVIIPEEDQEKEEEVSKEKIRGRLSAASYSNLSDYRETHRMRYAFSFRGEHLKNSKFSTDNYIIFRHTLGEWEEVQDNLARAIKVYSLSAQYDFDSTSTLTFGRKINHKISNMGAIDGFQYEKAWGKLVAGAIVGSRPDFRDYSLNLNLLQFGAYAAYVSRDPAKFQQTTFGFIEQRNRANTDRRFIYFQHSGELMENLHLFSSFELDLYENINNETNSTFRLTNLFASLRYRLSRKLRFSVAYDNRKNIIYYESYKNFIDQYIEDETRQGLRFGVNYRPFKFLTWGVNTSWRFQKSDINVSRNLNTYFSFSRIPVLNMRATLSANFLQTNYLDSRILGIRLSKEIIRRRLNGDMYFRMVNYQYNNSDNSIQQNIVGSSLSLRLLKQLTLYLYYEGTFDNKGQAFHRINTKIIQRF